MSRGGRNAERALFWTLAVAAFVTAAAFFGALAADHAAASYDDQRNNFAIVRVLAPEGAAGMAAAEAALDHAPHVSSAAPMTQRRAVALLREWGGADVANADDMPPLRLIEIDLDSTAEGDVGGDIEAALAQGGVTAQVVRAPGGTAGAGLGGNLRLVAWGGAGLFALVMGVLISFAARSLSARREDLATVMTDMGATTAQVSARVGDEAAIMGVQAGALGAIAAGVAAIIVLWLLMPGASAASLRTLIKPLDLAPLLIAPLLTAVAAGAGARAGAETASVQAARLA